MTKTAIFTRRPSFILILGLMLAVLAGGTPARGQEGAASKETAKPKGEIPLHISAARLEADQDQHRIVFKGNVKAVYGDSTLYADELLVFYQPKKGAAAAGQAQDRSPLAGLGGESIDRIEARGKVRLVQGDRVATGAKAIYYRSKDEIVLLGSPQVWRGENHLRGSKITFNLASRKVVVGGSSKHRVEVRFYQARGGGRTLRGQSVGGAPAGRDSRPR